MGWRTSTRDEGLFWIYCPVDTKLAGGAFVETFQLIVEFWLHSDRGCEVQWVHLLSVELWGWLKASRWQVIYLLELSLHQESFSVSVKLLWLEEFVRCWVECVGIHDFIPQEVSRLQIHLLPCWLQVLQFKASFIHALVIDLDRVIDSVFSCISKDSSCFYVRVSCFFAE